MIPKPKKIERKTGHNDISKSLIELNKSVAALNGVLNGKLTSVLQRSYCAYKMTAEQLREINASFGAR